MCNAFDKRTIAYKRANILLVLSELSVGLLNLRALSTFDERPDSPNAGDIERAAISGECEGLTTLEELHRLEKKSTLASRYFETPDTVYPEFFVGRIGCD